MLIFALKMMTNTFNLLTADEQVEATNGGSESASKGAMIITTKLCHNVIKLLCC